MSELDLLQRRHRAMGDQSPLFYDQPLELVKGHGVWLFDESGKRYLDVYNNAPCVGHCHPRVVQAMASQAATLNIHTRYLNDRIVSYAERLTATFDPSLDCVMFTCTGSEANELALRMARFCTGGKGVIVSSYNYHGNTTSLAEMTTALPSSEPFSSYARAVPIPCLYRAPTGTSATELVHIGQAIMGCGGTVDYLVDTVLNYPTLSEAYKVAALDVTNKLRAVDRLASTMLIAD